MMIQDNDNGKTTNTDPDHHTGYPVDGGSADTFSTPVRYHTRGTW